MVQIIRIFQKITNIRPPAGGTNGTVGICIFVILCGVRIFVCIRILVFILIAYFLRSKKCAIIHE